MLGLPLMVMGAAKQAVAKKIDKRARKDLKEAMGNVAGAMKGGSMAFRMKSDPVKISNGSDKKQLGAFRTRILAQQERKKQAEEIEKKEHQQVASIFKKGSDSSMKRKKDKGVRFTTSSGETVAFRMKGMPPILREPTAKQKANLPPNLIKAIEDAPPLSRYTENGLETGTPLNRAALGMTGRKGDEIPMMRSYGTPYQKRSAAGKAKLMKTKYGQTGKAIPNKQLIKPIFKKAKGDK